MLATFDSTTEQGRQHHRRCGLCERPSDLYGWFTRVSHVWIYYPGLTGVSAFFA